MVAWLKMKSSCQTWKFVLLLLVWFHVWKSVPMAHGGWLEKNDISDEEHENLVNDIALVEQFWTDPIIKNIYKQMEFLLGEDPKYGFVVTGRENGIFFNFSRAYHYNFPAVPFWREARLLLRANRDVLIRGQEFLDDMFRIAELFEYCEEVYNQWLNHYYQADLPTEKEYDSNSDKRLRNCIAEHEFVQHGLPLVKNRAYSNARDALELMLDSLYYSVNPMEYNAFPKRFHWSLFENMLYETTNFIREIHVRLDKGGFKNYTDMVRASGRTVEADELVKRLKQITDRLNNQSYPYHKMYFKGDQTASNNFWNKDNDYGLSNFQREVNDLVTNGKHFPDGVPYKNIMNGKKRWENSKVGLDQFEKDVVSEDEEYDTFFEKVTTLYDNFLGVEMLPEDKRIALLPDKDGKKVAIGDGIWNWDLDKGIQNMRLAWELMGGLLEEIKCYMKDTYYFDLREQALQATQLNLTKGALFSGLSETMHFPCRIENQTDLVSPYCTAENHEICAPMAPLEPHQTTDNEYYGGMALLKPKWVYRYKEEAKMCWGRRDHVMQHYACQCGFRLDCGNDLGVNITCQLTPNDLLRGQCRGSVGYPCKTLPLAPGRHHESCASGYCDLDENSCEDRPHTLQNSGVDSIWKVKPMNRLLFCLGGLLIVWTRQWMMMQGQKQAREKLSRMDPQFDRGPRRSFINRNNSPSLVMASIILVLQFGIVSGLRDDWYGFVSYEDASEFKTAYRHTCSYTFDIFREPREVVKRNNLLARRELLTPIRFFSKETKNSTEKFSLHIYNYPAIRNGYSVSYGFQRDKECLHGQDSECVVYPEIGRVRALVVNAERFVDKKHDLNFIKDHFDIEPPEQFVSILHGGSKLERKFYEAVFLGGYPDDPSRSSHQIDGKKYPLEIYMYFLDETVPSVSIATILVVLVAESSRDNPHIKPILNAVEDKLYDAERRFLQNNKAIVRRERLFHHLQGSTKYDVYRPMHTDMEDETVIHYPMESSMESESTFAKFEEAYEKLQALDSELIFLREDIKIGKEQTSILEDIVYDFAQGGSHAKDVLPNGLIEFKMLLYVAGFRGIVNARCGEDLCKSCEDFSIDAIRNSDSKEWFFDNFFGEKENEEKLRESLTNPLPEGMHQQEIIDLAAALCKHFDEKFVDVNDKNLNDNAMKELKNDDKYEMIRKFMKERIDRKKFNMRIREHFHGDGSMYRPDQQDGSIKCNYSKWHDWVNYKEWSIYKDHKQKHYIADAILTYIQAFIKFLKYEEIIEEIEDNIEKIANRLGFDKPNSMYEMIRYLKHGNKQKDLKHDRSKVHQQFQERKLPAHEKKRTLAELKGMEMPEEDIQEYEKLDPIKAIVDEAFQISWLIPQYGGYYYYEGSSPIPPCFRAQNVIVFKQPITMSKAQIEILTRIPTGLNRSKDIQFTTPLVHDTFFEVDLTGQDTEKSRIAEVTVPVYNHRKNHLFLGHDGVKKNAVDEWNKLEERRRNAAGNVKQGEMVTVTMLMSMIYSIASV